MIEVPSKEPLRHRLGATAFMGGIASAVGSAPGAVAIGLAGSSPLLQGVALGGMGAAGLAAGAKMFSASGTDGAHASEVLYELERHAETAALGTGMPRRVELGGSGLQTNARLLAKSVQALAERARARADEAAEKASLLRHHVESARTLGIEAAAAQLEVETAAKLEAEIAVALEQGSKDRILAIAESVRARAETDANDRARALDGAWAELA